MTDRRFGRYQVVRALGMGAMGQVYEGHDPQIDRRVAIKTIRLDDLSPAMVAEFEARFRAEMRAAGRLQHPNIVALHDAGRDEGIAYIVMEYVEGEDLKRKLDAGWRPGVAEAVDLVRQLLGALAAAHAQGVIHRDVKPANILLTPRGRLKLADFGVARLQDGADATRTRGMVVGTPKYAAPEQLTGGTVDERADLFSCGVLLYRLLAVALPFDGPNEMVVMHRLLHEAPPAPSTLNPEVPEALDAIVAQALAKDPAQRPADAAQFAALLAPFGSPGALDAGTATRTQATLALPPPAPRRRLWWAAAGVLLAVGAAALWWTLRPPPAVDLSGRWSGLFSCGELLGPAAASAPRAPFVDKFSLRIEGRTMRWERRGSTFRETASGTLEPDGRWSVLGSGSDSARNSRWQTQGRGFYNLSVSPHRLDGEVQIVSEDGKRVFRQCTVGAVREKGGG
jgi:hypothetical protein